LDESDLRDVAPKLDIHFITLINGRVIFQISYIAMKKYEVHIEITMDNYITVCL
jgi:hypothetical protein